jgi:hypothetical protein
LRTDDGLVVADGYHRPKRIGGETARGLSG